VSTTTFLAAAVALGLHAGAGLPGTIEVDCAAPGALEKALGSAVKAGQVDIRLHGVCKGNYVIDFDGVTLVGATDESGLAAPPAGTELPVLEVIDAKAALRGLVVHPGVVGVAIRGWNAELLLDDVDVVDPEGLDAVGVFARRGAFVRLVDTTLRDGDVGLLVDDDAGATLEHVTLQNQRVGVVIVQESWAVLSDVTIEGSRTGGLDVDTRSDVRVLSGTFRDNAQIHASANDGSTIRLSSGVVLGSDGDTTTYAFGAASRSTITASSPAAVHGHVSMIDGSSITLGDAVLHGDLVLEQFSNAVVRDSDITGTIYCLEGSHAICDDATATAVDGCPSPTCGSASAGTLPPPSPVLPEIDVPRAGQKIPDETSPVESGDCGPIDRRSGAARPGKR
jgi:hypothetical protein